MILIIDFKEADMLTQKCIGFAVAIVGLLRAAAVQANDSVFDIRVVQGRFEPTELIVPVDTSFQVRVTNSDPAAIEFESFELHREQVVRPGETITVYLPALSPGKYPYFDDFHRDTPEGAIVAK